jgi:hypothetical protein
VVLRGDTTDVLLVGQVCGHLARLPATFNILYTTLLEAWFRAPQNTIATSFTEQVFEYRVDGVSQYMKATTAAQLMSILAVLRALITTTQPQLSLAGEAPMRSVNCIT